MSFDQLSEPIKKYIRDQRWASLRPLQAAAIDRILSTRNHYILAARTASGKTEAAFLPVLSSVDFRQPGVQVLYIAPLIALINDQFGRVEDLCRNQDVKVTKWHGEASRTEKKKLLAAPEGIVLITPESLEAMFVNAPQYIDALFKTLKYVVIDEVHTFIGTDRGLQLKSILLRMQQHTRDPFRIIGLSATIGDYQEAKKITGSAENTKVLQDTTTKEIDASFRYFKGAHPELPLDLIKDLYKSTWDKKVLIFPNSRGLAEEVAVKLKKLSARANGHPYYFSHHSSVHKELREYVEQFVKNNRRHNFCIACTSTLELGIDIGTVDQVVQINAAHSIASLVQRIGRSGRREGERSVLVQYATDPWSLLQSLACWLLYTDGFIEPQLFSLKAYDILLHQILSTVKQYGGRTRSQLLEHISKNDTFSTIKSEDTNRIIDELLSRDLLEQIGPEMIIGITGERIVNSREFYSVFQTERNLKVIHAGQPIGEVPHSPQIIVGQNILLAARIWRIDDVDIQSGKIMVSHAPDGRKPLFYGDGAAIHPRIRQKMMDILYEKDLYPCLDSASVEVLEELRKDFAGFAIQDLKTDRPFLQKEKKADLYLFQGSRVINTLKFLLAKTDVHFTVNEHCSSFTINEHTPAAAIEKCRNRLLVIDNDILNAIETNPSVVSFAKWATHLPISMQLEILKERYFDIEQTRIFLDQVNFVAHTEG